MKKKIGYIMLMVGFFLMCIDQDRNTVTQIWISLTSGVALIAAGGYLAEMYM